MAKKVIFKDPAGGINFQGQHFQGTMSLDAYEVIKGVIGEEAINALVDVVEEETLDKHTEKPSKKSAAAQP